MRSEALPDGSCATVEPSGLGVIVSRLVDGVCVWGQSFAWGNDRDDPDRQERESAALLARMAETPDDFHRWWLR